MDGEDPYTYVAEHRLQRAADLLRASNLSATEVALECGFASSSHFTVAFKRAFGASPTEFRRG
ncbi:helix-turn-helix transcriptional regulator (plasmid) [Rhizobium sp. 32-5/1]|uniref:helix-turn-helix transcriptional regulator n=1 Tax=Rhizobium sp. 32-5/1 TaxID=3019602 RepID=UPI00240DD18E|nr:helix-turn-helix transcriptional regulator [Rhizobium sp. 32-5/1]WEZ86045.1 helix-turn-helix transcriptional regulator [Rhizobium sp. 32-5/1]